LSVVFAIAAAGTFAAAVIFLIDPQKEASGGVSFRKNKNSFSDVSFKTYDRAGKEINIKCDSVSENQKDQYIFENLVSTFELSGGELLTVSANTTKAVRKDKTECEFLGNVKLSTKSGLLMKTEKLFVDCNKKIAGGDSDVVISQENVNLSAKKYFFDMDANVFTLDHDAKGSMKSGKISADRLIIRFDDVHQKSVKSMDAFGNATYIAQDFDLRAQQSILYTKDEVKAHKNVRLICRQNSNAYDVRADSMQARIRNGVPGEVKANGSLIIKTKDVIIRADKGVFFGDDVKVFDNVVIFGEHGNIFGNTATMNMKTGDISVDKLSGIVKDANDKRKNRL
jgi:LPS export ABC transporter protein LptC